MLEKLFAGAPQNTLEVSLSWRWAMEHPYLHAMIAVSNSPYLIAVVLLVGSQMISRMLWQRGRDRRSRT